MRSVAWMPGHARLSVIPSGKRSAAAVLAQAHRPVRAVLDNARVGMGCLIELDVMRQIRPQPRARIWGTALRTSRTDVRRLASIAASIASSSTSSARPGAGPPELATRMSRLPKRSTAASTSC